MGIKWALSVTLSYLMTKSSSKLGFIRVFCTIAHQCNGFSDSNLVYSWRATNMLSYYAVASRRRV